MALDSNPGPTHVFVDAGGALTGLIDFREAYLSRPAVDLRTWPVISDRLALREGYLDGEATPGDVEVGVDGRHGLRGHEGHHRACRAGQRGSRPAAGVTVSEGHARPLISSRDSPPPSRDRRRVGSSSARWSAS
jgi:hypothetical protein